MPLVVVYSDSGHDRARLCRLLRPRVSAILSPVATVEDLTLTAALELISAIVVPAGASPELLRALLDEPILREVPVVLVADPAAAKPFARPHHFVVAPGAPAETLVAQLHAAIAFAQLPTTSRRRRPSDVHQTHDGIADDASLTPRTAATEEFGEDSPHRTQPVGPQENGPSTDSRSGASAPGDEQREPARMEAFRPDLRARASDAAPGTGALPPDKIPPQRRLQRPSTGMPDPRRPAPPRRERYVPGPLGRESGEPVDAHFVGARSELANWLETASGGRLRVQTHPSVEALLRTTTSPFASRYVVQLAPGETCEEALQQLRSATGLEPPRLAVLTDGHPVSRVHTRDFSSLRIFRGPFDPDEVVDFLCDGRHGSPARILTLTPRDADAPKTSAGPSAAGEDLARSLAGTDLVVVHAETIEEIFAAARARRVDLIALDATEDEALTLEACRQLREACGGRDPAIVLLVDQPTRELRREAFRAGADDVFFRPWPAEEAAHRAALLVERVRAWRERYAYDRLTGLHHTAVLGQRLVEALAAAGDDGLWTSLLVVDVDAFGHLVDRFGADAGDAALRMVADALSLAVGPDALIFRDFRDHFYVLPRWPLDREAQDSLRDRLEALGRVTLRASDGRGFYVSVTAGHILVPPEHGNADDCVRRVHRVLATARRSRATRLLTATLDPGGPA